MNKEHQDLTSDICCEHGCCHSEHEHGHEHEHDHEHEHEHCHEHEHGHEHCHEHEHGHEHCHEQAHNHQHESEHAQEHCHEHEHDHEHDSHKDAPLSGKNVTVYLIENLDCANCAAKIERKIKDLPGVENASITFATKQLRVLAKNQEKLLPLMQKACSSIEPDAVIILKPQKQEAEKKEAEDGKKELLSILFGAALFLGGILTASAFPTASLTLFVLAYLVLGLEIVVTAFRNLLRGNIFDENFLMSIATIGAFAIKEYPEAVGVMLFYRIGELFEHRAVLKSRSQIMDALDLRPETVNLLNGEELSVIPADEAKEGDLLLVRPGDRIPLDGVIVEGESRLDTSPVTGEPVPVSVKAGSSILSGCTNLNGVLKLKVEKPLSESMVTRILNSVENAAANKPQIDRFITRFSRVYTPFVVVFALCTAIIPSLITGDWNSWVYTALTFLVISCPCALVLSVPLAFFSGIGAGSKQGILFKGGASLEALKNIKAIVMDKTGTITKGNFVLEQIVSLVPDEVSETRLLSLAASCEAASTHPIAVSICDAAKAKGILPIKGFSVSELSGHGVSMETEEGLILCGNRKLMEANNVDTSAYPKTAYGTEVLLAMQGRLVGYLVIADTIKPETEPAVNSLKRAGLVTVMMTGDAEENARAVAEKTGIDEVYAKLLPEDKLNKLSEIRKKHGAVMFVGDGINDAPVLAGADVGAAMGSGADAAIEAADVVFLNSNMNCIPRSIKIARNTGRIAKQNVIFALVIKVLIMVLGLLRISSMWLAVFADTGVAMLCILNSIRILYKK